MLYSELLENSSCYWNKFFLSAVSICCPLLCHMEPQRLGFQRLFHVTLSWFEDGCHDSAFLICVNSPWRLAPLPLSSCSPLFWEGLHHLQWWSRQVLTRPVPFSTENPSFTILPSGHIKSLLCDSHCTLKIHQWTRKTGSLSFLRQNRLGFLEFERTMEPFLWAPFKYFLSSTFFCCFVSTWKNVYL